MHVRALSLGLSLCALVGINGFAAAEDATIGHDVALQACAVAHDEEVAVPITAIDDGRGGSLVWLTDSNANLWLCSAAADGQVYAFSMIFSDLLKGAGGQFVLPVHIGSDGTAVPPPHDPLHIAELACQAYLPGDGDKVVGKGADGLNADWIPGYFVFIETDAGETYLCDATPDAQVWAFAKIGAPLDLGNPVG